MLRSVFIGIGFSITGVVLAQPVTSNLLPRLEPEFRKYDQNLGSLQGIGTGFDVSGDVAVFSGDNGMGNRGLWYSRWDPGTATWSDLISIDPTLESRIGALGSSAAFDGTTFVVGDAIDDGAGPNPPVSNDFGAAYVYRYNSGSDSWSRELLMTPNGPEATFRLDAGGQAVGDNYGTFVAIDGDYIAIGVPGRSTEEGAVITYVRDNNLGVWQLFDVIEADEFAPGDGQAGERFGSAVAMQGTTLCISANRDNSSTGSVYFFERSGSGYDSMGGQKIPSPENIAFFQFGQDLAIDGDTVVIGTAGENTAVMTNGGRAYVADRNGLGVWTLSQELRLPVLEPALDPLMTFFGNTVDIKGDLIAIGAILNEDGQTQNGNVFVYNRSSLGVFTPIAQLRTLAGLSVGGLRFGADVALGDRFLLAGEQNNSLESTAYLYDLFEATGDSDCDGNLTDDRADILAGLQADANDNLVPDTCEGFVDCIADINGDMVVTPADFTAWINAFNTSPAACLP